MKTRKIALLAVVALAATCLFAGEALPADAVDWPAKLGMTPKMIKERLG